MAPKTQTVRARKDVLEASPRSALDHAPVGLPTRRLSDPLPPVQAPDALMRGLIAQIQAEPDANVGPFYEALFAGKVDDAAVRGWYAQFYYDVRAFLPMIAQLVANSTYAIDMRQSFGTNLLEEMGELLPDKDHPTLMRRAGRAIGLTDEQMEFVEPIPEVLLYVEDRHRLARDTHFLEGIAACSLVIELMVPGRYRKIGQALEKQFGAPHEELEFFWIHGGDPKLALDYGGDVQHSNEAAALIKKYATTAELQDRVRTAVWRSLQARKMYQWGLYREFVLKKGVKA